MRREYFLILSSLLIAPIAAGADDGGPVQFASERPFSLVPSEPAGRLTTIEARNLVAHWLQANGQQTVRIGTVVYDSGGNVLVNLMTAQGTLIRQILVDGRTHQIAETKDRHEGEG